ncbi:GGDEF domain-containing protein [Salinispira pacifica]|uniref:diguanylate cyclase n=1 Tax=Salinispira pacifica TaxID=1307761 RepID=V5WDT7_9SPIO|nr:sensor domain-containing diguanylate cyclase [Salinispira pacifica]AHC13729.1 GGDEF domain containing protein [Salinispira pacifica]
MNITRTMKDLLYANRRNILIPGVVYALSGCVLLFYSFGGNRLFLSISLLTVGVLALIYPLIYRRMPVKHGMELSIQLSICFLMVLAATFGAGLLAPGITGLILYLTLMITVFLSIRLSDGLTAVLNLLSFGAVTVMLSLSPDPVPILHYVPFFLGSALSAAVGLRINEFQRQLSDTRRELIEQSIVDPLTDVYNRRFFIEELERSVQRHKRYGHKFCLAVIDLDHFREVNDQFGPQVGDSVLESYAWKILDLLRESDVVSRYGGDSFMVILSEVDMEQAVPVMERLRRYFSETPFQGIERRITCSIGVVPAQSELNTGQLLYQAEQKLMEARRAGRDAVVS